MVGLDFKCEIAANNVGRPGCRRLYRHYGVELMEKVTGEMLDHTASLLRKRLLEVPDGVWRAQGNIEAGDIWKMQVELTKEKDHLTFDFTGTDKQAPVGINLPYHATVGACFESLLQTLGYDLPQEPRHLPRHGGHRARGDHRETLPTRRRCRSTPPPAARWPVSWPEAR